MRMMFDFKCTACDNKFEKLVDSSVVDIECPLCGSIATKELSSPGAFKFNGSGYYCTDFKGKK